MTEVEPLIAGRYRLDEPLAAGGMGVVWKGWDNRLHRPVAIKQLRLQSGLGDTDASAARDRAMREARITARLHHPNAVPIYDVVEHQGQPCLIMQYLPSRSLQSVLQQQGTLPLDDAARVGYELAAALAAAHRAGIVHRDVKPGNVLLAEDGSAKLTDFGISHALGDVSVTMTGMLTGTPAFLAPEVARGQRATFASDVFSLGSTLYTALEGRPPFEQSDNTMAVLHRVASGQFDPPRRSGPLAPLLLRMLSADPAARPSMLDVGHELAWIRDHQLAPGLPAPRPPASEQVTARISPARPSTSPPSAESATLASTRAIGRFRSVRSGRRRALLIATMIGLLAVGAAAFLYSLPRAQKNSPGAAAGTHHNVVATRSSAARRSKPTPTPRPSTSTSATSRSAVRTSTSSSPPGAPVANQLTRAITDYYALIPGNLAQGWARLTPSYQSGHAGGFPAYSQFWHQIARVAVSDLAGQPPDAAQATITYTYSDGRTVIERTAYHLVETGGVWRIQDSSVLSSRSV